MPCYLSENGLPTAGLLALDLFVILALELVGLGEPAPFLIEDADGKGAGFDPASPGLLTVFLNASVGANLNADGFFWPQEQNSGIGGQLVFLNDHGRPGYGGHEQHHQQTHIAIMTSMWGELRSLMRLALPVILAELGWMGMGIVDTIMVGRISPEAIGAVAIGNILFNTIGLLAFSVLLGLDTLISQAAGAGNLADARHSLRQGFWLALLSAPLLGLLMAGCVPLMGYWGLDQKVYDLAVPFSYVLSLSVLPIAFYTAQRRYLQCLHMVKPVWLALLTANLVNFGLNALLIPVYGVTGSAWATVGARVYLALYLYVALRRSDAGALRWEAPDFGRIGRLLRLGLPAAGHIFSEIAVFGAATALAGRFPAIALAAHEVTLNHASLAYMVPLGIASAAAVRVGNEIGAGKLGASRRAGNAALVAGAGFMGVSAILLFLFPRQILAIYTNDARVIAYAAPLLFWAGAFQLFDGIQAVATGALRGRGDTRAPFLAGLLGYWALGLPTGAWLCFARGYDGAGLWIGLSLGLAIVALLLLLRWLRASGRRVLPHDCVVAVDKAGAKE